MSALIAKASLLETVKSYLERILQQERSHMPLILHYEAAHRDLRPWLWPLTDASERLKPEQFCKYRETHYFRGPACLCGFLDGKVDYIESAFYVDSKLGYVAACSENRCGYRVPLDRVYKAVNLPSQKYVRRWQSPTGKAPNNSANDGVGMLKGIRKMDPLKRYTFLSLCMKLDDVSSPGLPEEIFADMFRQCRRCGYITTKDVFHHHACIEAPRPRVVVPDDSEEETEV